MFSASGFGFSVGVTAPANAGIVADCERDAMERRGTWSMKQSMGVKSTSTFLLLLWTIGACIALRDPDSTRPTDDGDLVVAATGDTATVFAGASVNVTAGASGGRPPYFYRWDVNAGSEDIGFDNEQGQATRTTPLEEAGRTVFRVLVTDSGGASAVDFVAIEVIEAFNIEAPPLAVVGEPIELVANVTEPYRAESYRWEVMRGVASLNSPDEAVTNLTASTAQTVGVRLTVTVTLDGGEPLTTERDIEIASVLDLSPRVLIETNLGDITLELDGEAAPRHTANMLLYVDAGFYSGLLFHRAVCETRSGSDECEPFVIQAGGYQRVDGEIKAVTPTRRPVESEADNGLSNGTLYSVALALSGGDSDSGTTQFFINLSADNDSLDDEFTVFGLVLNGRAVVDRIVRVETEASPILNGEVSLPVEDVIIERMTRLAGGEN